MALLTLSPSMAEPVKDADAKIGSISGFVALPEKLPEGVNGEGLSLTDAVVLLEGKFRYPSRSYPENWKKMSREERVAWTDEYEKTEAFAQYEKRVEEAEAKRFRLKTKVGEDGRFTFKGLKPDWYQLSAMIMHPAAKDKPGELHSRGYALRQFFVKKASPDVTLGKVTLKVQNVLMPGDMAPDFVVDGFDGKQFKLSDFRGQYVLFDFWATWCGPCIKEIPNLKAASEKFGGERFKVIGLSTDEAIDAPRAYLEKNPASYLQGHVGLKERYASISTAYGISYIPSIWLIGPDGIIIARDLLGDTMGEAVAKALEEK